MPLLFYTPETRWGLGATGTCIFNWKEDSLDARPSSLNVALAVTQNRQMFFVVPFHLFLRNAAQQLYGELAYNRYYYNFFGTGNMKPDDHVERYGLEFPRVRLTWLARVWPHFFVGPRVVYDRFSLFDLNPTGLLAQGDIRGSLGGLVAGPAAVLMYDSRNNVFYPEKGSWTEFVYFRQMYGVPFSRIAFDHSRYLGWGEKNVLAINLYSIYSADDLPFYQMGMLGGAKKMRGFYEGRYRDNNLVLAQAEYRRWIKGIFGVTVFGSVGQVASRFLLFHHNYWRFTYGAGARIRLDKVKKLNLRVDVAVGNGKVLPYFTVGEAF